MSDLERALDALAKDRCAEQKSRPTESVSIDRLEERIR
jgi:hypothetical protein